MRQVVVSETDAGQRLDKYLHKILSLAPKGFLYKMLRKKNITLNGARAAGSERLRPGDQIRLFLSEDTLNKYIKIQPKSPGHTRRGPQPKVVYEDDQILLVNKPVGLLSQKSSPQDYSLTEWIREYLQDTMTGEAAGFSPGLSNRLDRNTSGIAAAGKSVRAQQELSTMFRERQLSKYYLCPVQGVLKEAGYLQNSLHKLEKNNKVVLKDDTDNSGECARMAYRPLGDNGKLTLLEVELLTGKTHQIRAQLSAAGHPLVGDGKYGGSRWGRYCAEQFGCRYQMLHAWRLEFPLCEGVLAPLSGRVFYAGLPTQLQSLLQKEHLEDFIPWKKKKNENRPSKKK